MVLVLIIFYYFYYLDLIYYFNLIKFNLWNFIYKFKKRIISYYLLYQNYFLLLNYKVELILIFYLSIFIINKYIDIINNIYYFYFIDFIILFNK